MIVEMTMFGCVCDNCGKQWEDDTFRYVSFSDKAGIEEYVQEDSNWHTDYDSSPEKHYCSKCFGGYDDDDNLIINPKES